MHAHMCAYVYERQKVKSGVIFDHLFTLFFCVRVSHWTWKELILGSGVSQLVSWSDFKDSGLQMIDNACLTFLCVFCFCSFFIWANVLPANSSLRPLQTSWYNWWWCYKVQLLIHVVLKLVHIYNSSTLEAEAQGHHQPHNEFCVTLCYMRSWYKTTKLV